MRNYDRWLNKGNPADAEVDTYSLIEDLAIDLENLIHEYEVMGLEEDIIKLAIKGVIE